MNRVVQAVLGGASPRDVARLAWRPVGAAAILALALYFMASPDTAEPPGEPDDGGDQSAASIPAVALAPPTANSTDSSEADRQAAQQQAGGAPAGSKAAEPAPKPSGSAVASPQPRKPATPSKDAPAKPTRAPKARASASTGSDPTGSASPSTASGGAASEGVSYALDSAAAQALVDRGAPLLVSAPNGRFYEMAWPAGTFTAITDFDAFLVHADGRRVAGSALVSPDPDADRAYWVVSKWGHGASCWIVIPGHVFDQWSRQLPNHQGRAVVRFQDGGFVVQGG